MNTKTTLTPQERARLVNRATAALDALTSDPSFDRTSLGQARDLLNIARTHRGRSPVLAAVESIEAAARKANR